MATRLLVDHLDPTISNHDLRAIFGAFGEVRGVTRSRDPATNAVRGFAYVEMATEESAQACIERLSGNGFNGTTSLCVRECRKTTPSLSRRKALKAAQARRFSI